MNISLAVCCNLKGRLKHHLMFQTAFLLFALYAINPKYLRVRLLSMRLESGCRRCLSARRHLRAYGAKCGHFLGRASSLGHGGRCGVGWYRVLRRFVRGCMRIAKPLNLRIGLVRVRRCKTVYPNRASALDCDKPRARS